MAKPDPAPDPFHRDLDELGRLYVLLAAKVEPTQGEGGGRRPQPASRPPLNTEAVSLKAEVEQSVSYYLNRIRWLLYPVKRVDITARTKSPDLPDGARCPYCGGKLVGWHRSDSDDPGQQLQPDEVVCLNSISHHPDEPFRWGKADWPWLGRLAGVREDPPNGTARPPWNQVQAAEG